MKLNEIHIRDPFILKDEKSHKYYLYGTEANEIQNEFYSYESDDLIEWGNKSLVFKNNNDFWGKYNFWAPEVYFINGKYYMIASFKNDNHKRGCSILVSDYPNKEFKVYSSLITPKNWECLDGTLYFDNKNKPYLIFVHEWLEVKDGEVCSIRLSHNLKKTIGLPRILFKASEVSWSKKPKWTKENIRVTDGPFVIKNETTLMLMWSTFDENEYVTGFSIPSKDINKKGYVHSKSALKLNDAGHGMIFESFDSKYYLVLHECNCSKFEHPILKEVLIENNNLTLKEESYNE